MFPIKNYKHQLPTPDKPGGFGHTRKYDTHTGIDLYCEPNQPVYAMETGIVISILPFTGKGTDSPWWNDTYCIMIESESGVINYGEVLPERYLKQSEKVREGQLLGYVIRVLKTDKGLPMDMLHLELYTKGTIEPVWWHFDESKPKNLLDPYPLLEDELLKSHFDLDGL